MTWANLSIVGVTQTAFAITQKNLVQTEMYLLPSLREENNT